MALAITGGLIAGSGILPGHNIILGTADFIAELFMRLLKLVSLPIIFLSIATTISGLEKYDDLKKTGSQVLGYTISTTVCAATIALLLFLIIDPANPNLVNLATETAPSEQGMRYIDYLLNVVPSNVIQAFADNNVIGTLLIAVGIGVSSLSLPGDKRQTLHQLFSSLYAAVFQVTEWILKLVPVAIWGFTAQFVQSVMSQSLQLDTLSLYLFCVVGANILQAIVVLPLLLKRKGLDPMVIFKKMLPALQVAFWSKSSSAALPVALKHLKCNTDIDHKVASISMPLCISINMNGCAAFILTTVFFVSKMSWDFLLSTRDADLDLNFYINRCG